MTNAPAGQERHAGGGNADARPAAGSWWMLAVLLSYSVLSLIDRGAINLLVVPIQKDLGLSDIEMGLLLGPAFALSYAIFGLPVGWASDRFPRRWIIFIAIVIWSTAAAGAGLAWSFASLLVARVLVGIGEAALSPIAYTLIGDCFPPRRLTFAMSIYQMGSKLGAAASFAVVGAAAAVAVYLADTSLPAVGTLQPWQWTMLLTGAVGLPLAILVFTFREPPRRQLVRVAEQPVEFMNYLRHNLRLLVPMLLGVMICAFAVLAMGAWVPTLLERRYGLLPQQYGPILSMIHFVGAGSLVIKGMLVDWVYARGIRDAHLRFLSWMVAASVPLALTAFLTESLPVFWICFGIVEIIAGQFMIYVAATAQFIVPVQLRGRFLALVQAGFTIAGMGTGPVVVAFVTERVFGDPQRLGDSLALVVPTAFALALVSLRFALPAVRRSMGEGTSGKDAGGAVDIAADRLLGREAT